MSGVWMVMVVFRLVWVGAGLMSWLRDVRVCNFSLGFCGVGGLKW